MAEKGVEETKAELRNWILKNCLMSESLVDETVERMYNNLQEIGNDLHQKIAFKNAQEKFLAAESATKKANDDLAEAKKLRDRLCPHTKMTPKEYYFGGSYYDTAYTEYWGQCDCCGMTTERTSERHSWYG